MPRLFTLLLFLLLCSVCCTQRPMPPLTDLLATDPTRYGAVPNDGKDDSVAWAAMMAAVVEGMTIDIPAGVWELGTADTCRMHIEKNHIKIKGAGMGKTILKYTAVHRGDGTPKYDPFRGSCIFLGTGWGKPYHDIIVEDLTIQDLSADPKMWGCAAVWSFWVSDLTIRRVELIDCNGGNFSLMGGGTYGPPQRSLARNIAVEDCHVTTTPNKGFSNASAMTIGGFTGVRIRGNRFEGLCHRGGIEGGEMRNAIITENHIEMDYRDGLEGGGCMGNMALADAVVSKNILILKQPYRICFSMNSDGSTIAAGTNVIFEANLCKSQATGGAVQIQPSNGGAQQNIAIRNNQFFGSAYGVAIYWDIPRGILEVSRNTHDLNGSPGGELVTFSLNGVPGIPFRTDNQLVRITDNTMYGGSVTPNPSAPMAKICNFGGWKHGADRRVIIYGNRIGSDPMSSCTGGIDGNTVDPPKAQPPLDIGCLEPAAVSATRYLTIDGLIPGDAITCTPDVLLPLGLTVQTSIVLRDHDNDETITQDGKPVPNSKPTSRIHQVAWHLRNESNEAIDPPASHFRFSVERK